MENISIWDSKVANFVACVLQNTATPPEYLTLDEAIKRARRMAPGFDDAELFAAEAAARTAQTSRV